MWVPPWWIVSRPLLAECPVRALGIQESQAAPDRILQPPHSSKHRMADGPQAPWGLLGSRLWTPADTPVTLICYHRPLGSSRPLLGVCVTEGLRAQPADLTS